LISSEGDTAAFSAQSIQSLNRRFICQLPNKKNKRPFCFSFAANLIYYPAVKKELTLLKLLTVMVVITALPFSRKQVRHPHRQVVPPAPAESRTALPPSKCHHFLQ
jgi:hypothetical protein